MKKKEIVTEIFINESSLQGQFQTIEQFEKAVRKFMGIFRSIKQKDTLKTELYKSAVFLDFQAIKGFPFQASLNQIKDKSLKRAFTELIFNKINTLDWRNQRIHQSTDKYTLVENSQEVTDTSIAEVAERKLQKTEIAYLLINFSGSNFQTLHSTFLLCRLITVIKNQFPFVIHLDCLDTQDAFEEWVKDKLDFRHLLKKETSRFKKTACVVQGQSVYIEIETNHYWYLDNLHKNHFEVFDNQGNHLGEADLEGNLDSSKRDKNKKL